MKMTQKVITILTIFLFIGVAIAPSINFSVVKASNDNQLIEVTSEACGVKGFGNTTVKLTRQQYQDLQEYLVDFGSQLNKTTTRAEAVPIFNKAVLELNKYGLLPKGINVEQAQKLVTGGYQNNKYIQFLENYYPRNQLQIENESNAFCLMYGHIGLTIPAHLALNGFIIFLNIVGSILNFIGWFLHAINLGNLILSAADALILFQFLRSLLIPSFLIGTEIYFAPYSGDLYTIGVNGFKHWNGILTGGYPIQYLHGWEGGYTDFLGVLNLGIIGFTGIHLATLFNHSLSYLIIGSAVSVKIKVQS